MCNEVKAFLDIIHCFIIERIVEQFMKAGLVADFTLFHYPTSHLRVTCYQTLRNGEKKDSPINHIRFINVTVPRPT